MQSVYQDTQNQIFYAYDKLRKAQILFAELPVPVPRTNFDVRATVPALSNFMAQYTLPSIHYYELTMYYGETWHAHAICALMNKKQLSEEYTLLRRVRTCPQKQCNQLLLGSQ